MNRLETDLMSGDMLRMHRLKPENRAWGFHHYFEKLRLQCETAAVLAEPQEYSPESHLDGEPDVDGYINGAKIAAKADKERDDASRLFNSIFRLTCRRCPECAVQIFPYGFDDLLDHIRIWHPLTFWNFDDWSSVGKLTT